MSITGPPTLGPWWTCGTFLVLLPLRPCTKPASMTLTGLDNGVGKFFNSVAKTGLDGLEFLENSDLVDSGKLKHTTLTLHPMILMVLSPLRIRISINFSMSTLSSMRIRIAEKRSVTKFSPLKKKFYSRTFSPVFSFLSAPPFPFLLSLSHLGSLEKRWIRYVGSFQG